MVNLYLEKLFHFLEIFAPKSILKHESILLNLMI